VSIVGEFLDSVPFEPDPFQRTASLALEEDLNVVVTAPTGAGKTLVAEAAVHLGYRRGNRTFYTTPIKALSNQKFGDLVDVYGASKVGLLTGDNVINPEAPIVVMTTEVLRNMIYADSSSLDRIEFVILDEVHYLQDRFRGAVWEEVIIHSPDHVRLVCLSATLANADEFAGWIEERRGPTELVVATQRPVPLESMYLVADRAGSDPVRLFPMFTKRDHRMRPNPRLEHLLGLERGRRRRFATPSRIEVVESLAAEEMLPAIYFVFSRAGCDAASWGLAEAGLRLTEARDAIRRIAEEKTAHLSDADLGALDYGRWLTVLESGVAAHHAGLVPAFKETVEELFAAGLLKVVFATETLALGINMPARSVVLENLSKFDGESHSLLEPGDYTQLTGRAGRRGIDTKGYGVVLHSRFVDFDQVVSVASTGAHPLRSSFRPTYNMAANLVAKYPEAQATELISASFAQYQRSGSQAGAEARLRDMEDRLADEIARAECERGSISEYFELLDKTTAPRIGPDLHPGDALEIPGGQREGRFVILRRLRGKKTPRFLVLGSSGRISTIGDRDLVAGSRRIGKLGMARPYRGNDRKLEQSLLRGLRNIPRETQTEEKTVEHPVAECPQAGAHVSWYRRARRTERRIEQLRARLRTEGVGLVEDFHAIRHLLEEWGYLDGWSLTARGERLRFVYNEMDLLLTESVQRGHLLELSAEELAALVSCFIYEPRGERTHAPSWPTSLLEERFEDLLGVWDELSGAERTARVSVTRCPDPGFVSVAYTWAAGTDLADLDERYSPGDFVRVSRQLVDLLRQLRDTFPELSSRTREALVLIDRGVVAAQGVT